MGALDGAHSESDFQGHHYYEIARAILSVDVVEGGSLERVQAVAILANYLQRSDKPDAGYLWLYVIVIALVTAGAEAELVITGVLACDWLLAW